MLASPSSMKPGTICYTVSTSTVHWLQYVNNIFLFRLGFHWPPFCTISHLHLHAISPEDQIKTLYWLCGVFSPNTPWFKTVK